MNESESHRFQVALSFSGEHRDYMLKLAKCLHERVNPPDSDPKDGRVFYDFWFEDEINGPIADEFLQNIYNKDSLVVIVGVAKSYESKPWCQAEWEAIRALYFHLRPSKDSRDRLRIFYLRFDDEDVRGVWPTAGYTDARARTPDQVADLVCDRLEKIGQALPASKIGWVDRMRGVSETMSRFADYFFPPILRRHPILSIMVPLAVVAANMLWQWYLFLPASVAVDYYNAIGAKEFERAWGHADDEFRTKRFTNLDNFKLLYATTQTPSMMRAEPEKSSIFSFFKVFFSETRLVTLKYEVFERFTKQQLEQENQFENRLWVQIYHKNDFPKLMDGSLKSPEGTAGTSLPIRRYFEENVVLKHENGEWKIISIQKAMRALKRLTE